MSFCGEVTGSDLCGLDDGEVVNPAKSSSHRCSEPRCAEAHPAAESVPQITETTRRHQSLHLSPSPAVLQPGTGSFHESPGKLKSTHTKHTHPPLEVVPGRCTFSCCLPDKQQQQLLRTQSFRK